MLRNRKQVDTGGPGTSLEDHGWVKGAGKHRIIQREPAGAANEAGSVSLVSSPPPSFLPQPSLFLRPAFLFSLSLLFFPNSFLKLEMGSGPIFDHLYYSWSSFSFFFSFSRPPFYSCFFFFFLSFSTYLLSSKYLLLPFLFSLVLATVCFFDFSH